MASTLPINSSDISSLSSSIGASTPISQTPADSAKYGTQNVAPPAPIPQTPTDSAKYGTTTPIAQPASTLNSSNLPTPITPTPTTPAQTTKSVTLLSPSETTLPSKSTTQTITPAAPIPVQTINPSQTTQTATPVQPIATTLPPSQTVTPTAPTDVADTPASKTTQTATPISPTDVAATPAPSANPYADALASFQATAQNWQNGVSDPLYAAAANTAIQSLSLMNQAQMDQLKMQIASDPTLAGQGAGYAALASMARSANSNIDQVIGTLSQASMQRILDMQKYGFEQGVNLVNDINTNNANVAAVAQNTAQIARTNNLQDANNLLSTGDYVGAAAALNKTIQTDMPGSGIVVDPATLQKNSALTLNADALTRANKLSDYNALISAGNYQGAADLMNQVLQTDNPGAAPITADSLKANDPNALNRFNAQMSAITSIAATNPTQAATLLAPLMQDPTYASWFPKGATAQDIIKSIVQGNTSQNLSTIDNLSTEINKNATSSQSFSEVSGLYPQLFAAQGRNAIQEGQQISSSSTGLADINAIRAKDGLGAFTQDPKTGQILDDMGLPLTEADYTQLAYQKDYADKQTAASKQPWQTMETSILQAGGQKILDDSLYQGGVSGLTSMLQNYYMNPANFTVAADGSVVANTTNIQLPWNDPSLYAQFHTMPTAAFNADGSVADPTKIDMGGDVYGSIVNGTEVKATPADAAVTDKWTQYVRSGNPDNLTAQQWYFATAGGTMAVNTKNIPDSVNKAATTVAGAPTTQPGIIDPVTQTSLQNTFASASSTETEKMLQDPTQLKALIDNKVIPAINSPSTLSSTDWNGILANNKGSFTINGKAFQVDQQQASILNQLQGNIDNQVTWANNGGSSTYIVVTDLNGNTYGLVTGGTAQKAPIGSLITLTGGHPPGPGAANTYNHGAITTFDQIQPTA